MANHASYLNIKCCYDDSVLKDELQITDHRNLKHLIIWMRQFKEDDVAMLKQLTFHNRDQFQLDIIVNGLVSNQNTQDVVMMFTSLDLKTVNFQVNCYDLILDTGNILYSKFMFYSNKMQ